MSVLEGRRRVIAGKYYNVFNLAAVVKRAGEIVVTWDYTGRVHGVVWDGALRVLVYWGDLVLMGDGHV